MPTKLGRYVDRDSQARGVSLITLLKNGTCIDGVGPTEKRDLWLVDGRIATALPANCRVDRTIDISQSVVMSGGIDIHTHIGGGKVNLARLLLTEQRSHSAKDPDRWTAMRPLSSPVPPVGETGFRYLEMGYTTCFEPAVLPANARHAHCEMADIPWLDTGGYLVLGNDRLLLEWIASQKPQSMITAYVGAMLELHRCCGIKVVNAGGIDAFKFNARHLDVDQPHPHFAVTPRQILRTLAQAVDELKLPHPLHVHCSNLGVAGNIQSTLKTLEAIEGRRVHITHAQYHCYGKNGPHGYSSEAALLAEYVNWHPEVTIDVGQVLFGQTVTISADTMHQFENRNFAKPRKSIFQDSECQAGCGVVPFRYRHDQYVHSLQWSIGLELCLRVLDPSRVFLTTDHPNGGPFTAYPHLIRLLTSYDFRMSILDRLHPEVRATSHLPSLKREYTLDEIALMTRRGPAKILGLHDRGHLQEGAIADLAIYHRNDQVDTMFAKPTKVFRRGELVFSEGKTLGYSAKQSIVATPEFDRSWLPVVEKDWVNLHGYNMSMFRIETDELVSEERSVFDVMTSKTTL